MSDNTINSQVPGNLNQNAIDNSLIIQAEAAILFPFMNSTISQSELTAEISALTSGSPQLSKPETIVIVMAAALDTDQIITNILSQWNQSLQEIAQRIQDELNSPAYLSWLAANSPLALLEQESISPQQSIDSTGSSGTTGSQPFISSLPVDVVNPITTPQTTITQPSNPTAISSVNDTSDQLNITSPGSSSSSSAQPFISSTPVNASIYNSNLTESLVFLSALSAILSNTMQNIPGVTSTDTSNIASAGTFPPMNPSNTPTANIAGSGAVTGVDTTNNTTIAGAQSQHFVISSVMMSSGAFALVTSVQELSNTSQVDSKVLIEAWNVVNPGNNDQATLIGGWFSAMWGIGLLYQLSTKEVENYGSPGGNNGKKDLSFATNYANELLNSLNSPQFNASMMAIITTALQSSPETNQQDPQTLLLKGKLILLAMSLALIVKLEEGQVSDLDFGSLLTGATDPTKADPYGTAGIKQKLIQQIFALKNELAKILPADQVVSLFDDLLTYIQSDPDIDNLLDQQEVFENVLNPQSLELENITETPA